MDITKRIDKIKDYFVKFNIDEEAITVILKFPSKWTIPDMDFLKKQYNTAAGATPYGVVYATELTKSLMQLNIPSDLIWRHRNA